MFAKSTRSVRALCPTTTWFPPTNELKSKGLPTTRTDADSHLQMVTGHTSTTLDTMLTPRTTGCMACGIVTQLALLCVGFASTGGSLGATASSPPSEGTLISLGLTGSPAERPPQHTTTSLDFNPHFIGADVNRSFHVAFAACYLDAEIVHSTFLCQINGSIPRMLLTSFLEAHAHRCQNR